MLTYIIHSSRQQLPTLAPIHHISKWQAMRSPQPGRSLYSCRAALIGSKLLPRWWWSRTRTSRTRVTKSHIRNVSGTGSAWTQISKTCQRCHYGTQKQVAGATYLSLSLSEEEDHMGLWRWGEEWTPDGECWKKGGGGNGILSSMDSNSRNNKNSERKKKLYKIGTSAQGTG